MQHLHGKFVVHPFVARKLPIIADTMVDINFGTGGMSARERIQAYDVRAEGAQSFSARGPSGRAVLLGARSFSARVPLLWGILMHV